MKTLSGGIYRDISNKNEWRDKKFENCHPIESPSGQVQDRGPHTT